MADAGPLHYLVLIGQVNIFPKLFGTIAVPTTVVGEIRHQKTPDVVRAWMHAPPSWLAIHNDPMRSLATPPSLDRGESAAIALAEALHARLLLLDDRVATTFARRRGLATIGTIGLLLLAAESNLLDLPTAVDALRATNFYYPPALFDALLTKHGRAPLRDTR